MFKAVSSTPLAATGDVNCSKRWRTPGIALRRPGAAPAGGAAASWRAGNRKRCRRRRATRRCAPRRGPLDAVPILRRRAAACDVGAVDGKAGDKISQWRRSTLNVKSRVRRSALAIRSTLREHGELGGERAAHDRFLAAAHGDLMMKRFGADETRATCDRDGGHGRRQATKRPLTRFAKR